MKLLKTLCAAVMTAIIVCVSALSSFAAENYIVLYGFAFDINSDGEAVIHSYDDRDAEVVIPQSLMGADVAQIDDYAFFGDEAISSLSFEKADKLRKIGSNAFYGCTGLKSVRLPSGVSELGFGAFQGCSGLEEAVIGSGLNSLPSQCFYKCESLRKVVIPDTLSSLGARSFGACTSLSDVEIPDSVSQIADNAFEGCENVVIYCNENSYAQEYAERNNLSYDFIRTVLSGDVNLDGRVDISDVTLIQKYEVGLKPLPLYRGESYANVNGDEDVTIRDATLIQMYLAGIKTPYSIGMSVDK